MFTEIDRIAQMEFAREEGEKRGEERGREEGRKEQTLVIVRNLLQQEIDVEQIAAATGLSVEEIKALK